MVLIILRGENAGEIDDGSGGDGGGLSGERGTTYNPWELIGLDDRIKPGTQNSGNSVFYGQNVTEATDIGGGGGGYWGGCAGVSFNSGGAGGSGYVGGHSTYTLSNTQTKSGLRYGSGYAKITYVGP
ncbi:MAG: glycine-rich protein [Clostridia bacterium]